MREFIPTPARAFIELGPFTIHFYALCIVLGASSAILITRRRYASNGGNPDQISDIALYAIPSGLIGARLYHVISSPQAYFGTDGHPLDALKVWQGGLAIWGAIAGGALGAYFRARRIAIPFTFPQLLDIAAPGLALAQAIGRWGNWFNGELFGKPTTIPWALEIPIFQRPNGYGNFATFHPTFLYESLWLLMMTMVLSHQRWNKSYVCKRAGAGSTFALYVALYTTFRIWTEWIRIDAANHIFGLRVNLLVSVILSCGSIAFLISRVKKNHGETSTLNNLQNQESQEFQE